MDFLDQERQTVAIAELGAQFVDVSLELSSIGIFPAIDEPPRTRWIVKIENGRLRKCVRGASAGGMERIPFEFDRPTVNGCRDQRNRAGAARHRGRVVKKFPGNGPLRALGERNQMHFRATATR